MEKRKPTSSKSSPLPLDYTTMVIGVLTANFDAALATLAKLAKAKPQFSVMGAVYADEVAVAVSLNFEGQLAATTVHASCDFDPKASSPKAQELLGACVDAAGAVLDPLLNSKDEKILESVISKSLGALEDVPFDWAKVEIDRYKVWLKVDKSNPALERLADSWLEKNDPDRKRRLAEEAAAAEELIVTGDKVKKKIH